MFYTADTCLVTIHITIVAVAGRINKQVKNDKDEQSVPPIGVSYPAECKKINRQQEKRKMKAQ